MSNMFAKIVNLITGSDPALNRPFKKLTERQLIQKESEIGRDLFGPIPAGHRREFFCLDSNTWVWHEEWKDADTGKRKVMTTRYEIHQNGVLKVQDGTQYKFIEGEELQNLYLSTRLYYEQVMRGIYQTDPYTGQHLAPQN
jgi:hypothetical protein